MGRAIGSLGLVAPGIMLQPTRLCGPQKFSTGSCRWNDNKSALDEIFKGLLIRGEVFQLHGPWLVFLGFAMAADRLGNEVRLPVAGGACKWVAGHWPHLRMRSNNFDDRTNGKLRCLKGVAQ